MAVRHFTGLFLLVFSILVGATGVLYVGSGYEKTGRPDVSALLKGIWPAQFERNFGEILAVYETSRNLWGRLEYALFDQGRKDVVIGSDGWLFSGEEFSVPRHAEQIMQDNLDFIAETQARLKQAGVDILVALVPAKASIYADKLGRAAVPGLRRSVYDALLSALAGKGIRTVDLRPALLSEKAKEGVYLKTDTHWSPAGARVAAQTIAAALPDGDRDGVAVKEFTTRFDGEKPHEGDLLRYVPGVRDGALAPDSLVVAATEAAQAGSLFDDETPAVVLVGTSYSANPLWNFEGFLKESLKADVLNMADEGLGPFTVMDRFLESAALQGTPPRLLIWEIPERYMLMPHDAGKSGDGKAQGGEVF